MDEQPYELLETKDADMREYVRAAGDRVVLTVVYSKENVRVVHAPDICLSGGGSTISDEATETVSFGDGPQKRTIFNKFIVKNGSARQVVLFLYKAGTKLATNPLQMQFNFFINKALRRTSHSVALIRFSSYAVNDNIEAATRKAKQFATEAMPVLLKYLP